MFMTISMDGVEAVRRRFVGLGAGRKEATGNPSQGTRTCKKCFKPVEANTISVSLRNDSKLMIA